MLLSFSLWVPSFLSQLHSISCVPWACMCRCGGCSSFAYTTLDEFTFSSGTFFSADQSFSLRSHFFYNHELATEVYEKRLREVTREHRIRCFCGGTFCVLWLMIRQRFLTKLENFQCSNKMFPPQKPNTFTHSLTHTLTENVKNKIFKKRLSFAMEQPFSS